jgi:hypothetical protein
MDVGDKMLTASPFFILDEFMKKQSTDFEIGKRHLANIMSMDADTMSQEDIDVSNSPNRQTCAFAKN